MSENRKNTAVKAVKQAAAAAAIALSALLAGCGNSFAGTYKHGDGSVLTVNADGTCTSQSYGISSACKWKKTGNREYSITEETFLGDVSYTVREDSGNYAISMFGISVPLEKVKD